LQGINQIVAGTQAVELLGQVGIHLEVHATLLDRRNGWSAGAAARLSKPATISRATTTTNFFLRLAIDFIAEYPFFVAFHILRKLHS
jgi:hypothetical protein